MIGSGYENLPSPPVLTKDRYDLLLQHSPVFIYAGFVGMDSLPLYVSPRIEEMLGYPAADWLSGRATWQELIHPEDQERTLAATMRHLDTGEPLVEEYRLIARDGRIVYVHDETVSIQDADGRPIYDQALLVDMTEARRSEEALRQTERQFRATFEHAPVGIAHCDMDGHWLRINERLLEVYGYSRQELDALTFKDITHPDDLQPDLIMFERLLAGEIDRYSVEKRYFRRDGSYLHANVTISLVRDDAGRPDYTIAIVEDIGERKLAEEALRGSDQRLRSIYDSMTLGVNITGPDGWYVEANRAFLDLTGYTIEELRELRFTDITHPQDARRDASLRRELTTGQRESYQFEKRYIHKSGRPIWVRLNVSRMGGLSNSAGMGDIAIVEDITDRKAIEERYRRIVETAGEGIWEVDAADRITFVNAKMATMLGCPPDEVIGRSLFDFIEDDGRAISRTIQELRQQGHGEPVEGKLRCAGGAELWVLVSSTAVRDEVGTHAGILSMFTDISERKAHEEQLQHLALHDALTGLPNRTLFADRLAHALLAARRDDEPLSVLLLDVDRFKDINDTLGHAVGDAILGQISARFCGVLRESDTVARLGGDEFGILLTAADEQGAVRAAMKLLAGIVEPFDFEGHALYVAASIGIATFPRDGDDTATLLRRADIAMYAAKRAGSGWAIYQQETDPNSEERLALISALREAIEDDLLTLVYQPKIMLGTDRAEHVEALLRWEHPTFGLIPPDHFVSLAEHTGLIRRMTQWVLTEAVRQAVEWRRQGLEIGVAVNLSVWNLQDPQLVDNLAGFLERSGATPEMLTLEITESALMIDPARALHTVTRLHQMGVGISIDDFGTGFSSLAYLSRLPVDEIKIDKSFVLDMGAGDANSRVIVASVIDLGHNLGLNVVAEGVENRETLDRLASLGCDLAQGHFLSEPLAASEYSDWLRRWQGEAS